MPNPVFISLIVKKKRRFNSLKNVLFCFNPALKHKSESHLTEKQQLTQKFRLLITVKIIFIITDLPHKSKLLTDSLAFCSNLVLITRACSSRQPQLKLR